MAFGVLVAIIASIGVSAEKPHKAEATFLSSAEKGRLVYAAGKKYIGTPYVSQGLYSGYGMDCSEFTLTAYKQALGIRLYDSPASQMSRGRWVSNPRKGDLLFWSEDRSGYPTHVGLARGDALMTLHASSYFGRVVVSDGSYIPGYIGAKRLV